MMNIVVVYFIYGLAFFSMGLAMALEAGRSPSLAEAQILRPLAVFGFLHGMHEWLEMLILQMAYFDVEIPITWLWLRLSLLVLSFVSLIAFGIQVLRPPKRLLAMDVSIGGGLLALYIALLLLIGAIFWVDMSDWVGRADILARYLLAISGALLAAMALRRQANQAMDDGRGQLYKSLNWAAVGFLFYAISQIFVPTSNTFPANVINAEMFSNIFHFPIQVFRAGIAIVITISLIRATQIIEKERQKELLETQQAHLDALKQVKDELLKREALRKKLLRHTVNAQEEERAHIARELHDETAQVLTGFTLDLAALRSYLPEDENVQKIMNRLLDLSRLMSRSIYRLVHDLRPAQLDELGLVAALEYLREDFHNRMGLVVDMVIHGEPHRLEPEVETVCFRVIQEALTNIVRHAETDRANIETSFDEHLIQLRIQDGGVGFDFKDEQSGQTGWGIAGMRDRVRSVDGEFLIDSEKDMGTVIEITIPIRGSKPSQKEADIA